jgi:hypothetical protein
MAKKAEAKSGWAVLGPNSRQILFVFVGRWAETNALHYTGYNHDDVIRVLVTPIDPKKPKRRRK